MRSAHIAILASAIIGQGSCPSNGALMNVASLLALRPESTPAGVFLFQHTRQRQFLEPPVASSPSAAAVLPEDKISQVYVESALARAGIGYSVKRNSLAVSYYVAPRYYKEATRIIAAESRKNHLPLLMLHPATPSLRWAHRNFHLSIDRLAPLREPWLTAPARDIELSQMTGPFRWIRRASVATRRYLNTNGEYVTGYEVRVQTEHHPKDIEGMSFMYQVLADRGLWFRDSSSPESWCVSVDPFDPSAYGRIKDLIGRMRVAFVPWSGSIYVKNENIRVRDQVIRDAKMRGYAILAADQMMRHLPDQASLIDIQAGTVREVRVRSSSEVPVEVIRVIDSALSSHRINQQDVLQSITYQRRSLSLAGMPTGTSVMVWLRTSPASLDEEPRLTVGVADQSRAVLFPPRQRGLLADLGGLDRHP